VRTIDVLYADESAHLSGLIAVEKVLLPPDLRV